MRFLIETEQRVLTTYEVYADNEEAALDAYFSGQGEEVEQFMEEELIGDVYSE